MFHYYIAINLKNKRYKMYNIMLFVCLITLSLGCNTRDLTFRAVQSSARVNRCSTIGSSPYGSNHSMFGYFCLSRSKQQENR